MPSDAYVAKLNEQIGHEFAAHQQYVAIAVHYDAETLPQLSHFFYRQALEERDHAMMMVQYLLDADEPAVVPGVAAPQVESASARAFHRQGLANTDDRVAANKPVSPAFLFAVLLWPLFEESVAREAAAGADEYASLMLGAQTATRQQNELAIIPKRFALPMQEIWTLQNRLEQRRSRRALRLLSHPRFRAAYDFLAMREAAGEAVGDSVAWWTDLQQAHPEQRKDLLEPERRGRRRRSRKRPAVADLS